MIELEFKRRVLENPFNRELLDRLAAVGLKNCHLTAGCLFQTVWNGLSGRKPDEDIKDYDVFYFDDQDLSWEAEDQAIRRVAKATSDLLIDIEVRNQARVHQWYPQRFGRPYPALTSAQDGIDRFLIACTCVGMEVRSGHVYAPNGFSDVEQGLLRPNPPTPDAKLFRQKAESYRRRWPWLRVVPS